MAAHSSSFVKENVSVWFGQQRRRQRSDQRRHSTRGRWRRASTAVAADCCEVQYVSRRRVTQESPWCHQRFWASCAEEVHTQGRGCPLCQSTVDMLLLQLYWTTACWQSAAMTVFFMVALWNRADHYILWSPYVIGRPYIFSACDFYLSFFFHFFLA